MKAETYCRGLDDYLMLMASRIVMRRADYIEELLVDAMMLQDFDYLDVLCVVEGPELGDVGVASLWPPETPQEPK